MKKFNSFFSNDSKRIIPISTAIQILNELKESKILLSGSFSDKKWIVTNECRQFTLGFDINPESYEQYQDALSIKFEDFIDSAKVFVLSKIGSYEFLTLHNFLITLSDIIDCSYDEITSKIKKPNDVHFILKDFFSSIKNEMNGEFIDMIIESLDFIFTSGQSGKQRQLASFKSYILFDSLFEDFWSKCCNLDERLFYFPLWFWWNISGVVPMRPMEILLTPRNCLLEKDDSYFLIIRKSKLKGTKKMVFYKIDKDYEKMKIQITKQCYSEIHWYINETKPYYSNEIDTLFSFVPHYKYIEKTTNFRKCYFSYLNFITCLNMFYQNVICSQYNYTIINDLNKIYLDNYEIQQIHLGDSRHISLINMILEGASPVVAQILAGHEEFETTSHYFSNISQIVECRAYVAKQNQTRKKEKIGFSLPDKPFKYDSFVELDDGLCFSPNISSDFSDCKKAFGPNGEIGFCKNCKYYNHSNLKNDSYHKKLKKELDVDGKLLLSIVKKVQRYKVESSETVKMLQKINAEANRYFNYLVEQEGEEI